MASISVRGANLYFERSGAGQAVIFIHGMCGNANAWDNQIRLLSDRCDCVTYDRRGHTRSTLGNIEQRSVELHADDAADFIRQLNLQPCLLVASSGGARIGVDLLLRYPQLFSGAVLSEPPILSLDPERGGAGFVAQLQPSIGAALQSGNPRAAVDAFFEYVCPGLWRQLDDAGREPYRANYPELMGDLQMPAYEVSEEALRSINTPTTFVTGETSLPIFQRIVRVLAADMPHARLVAIPGTGHVTYAEAPTVFAEIVRARSHP